MNMISPQQPVPAAAIRPEGAVSLAEVRDRVEALPSGTERRDTLSAFRVLSARLDLDSPATPATAASCARCSGQRSLEAQGERAASRQHPRAGRARRPSASACGPGRRPERAPLDPAWAALWRARGPRPSAGA
jgi:hypothetical protein